MKPFFSRLLLALTAVLALANLAHADEAGPALKARYQTLTDKLQHNAFNQPVYLESVQTSSNLKGDVYAVIDQPFATFAAAVNKPENWCDILILHLNIKYCRAGASATDLLVYTGRKIEQPLKDAYKLQFAWHSDASSADYSKVSLQAGAGPMGTKDYHIVLESVPVDAGHTFIHLSYAYGFGVSARLAMQTYLSTVGSDKEGFTEVDSKPVGGVRGLVERNTMRYYLAIAAYLKYPTSPDKRDTWWFDATEHYPDQLHEVEKKDDYLTMKRNEYKRQQSAPDA